MNTLPDEGLRERKRRETRQRIAEAGQRLFMIHGYDATTLDAIAAEAGISRRTFFAYFRSKDEIILFWQAADSDRLVADLLRASPDASPLDAVRDIMVKHIAGYTTEEMTAVDDLMRSSEALLARKPAYYAELEHAIYEALAQVWRQPERQVALRMVAVVAVGAMRLTLQAWREQTGKRRPIAQMLRETFESLRVEPR
ncbi:TetR/AcrR family transcriptional regulator [Luteibacter sp. CQ10]|uniref:TetR/AcrR family transcriptional regulator n=1 Tax=Luteibacter sp. CQ10 TaxID=2805821 RepID=UPI0034A35D76